MLYNMNERYRELLDKDDEGIATEEEQEELKEVYQEVVRMKTRNLRKGEYKAIMKGDVSADELFPDF